MGTPKGLVEFGGRYWIERQRAELRRAGLSRHIVVLGFHADDYQARIPGLPVVLNPDPELGPFSSLLEGLSCVGPRESAAYVLPIDVPCADPQTWQMMGEALKEGLQAVVPEYRGMGGHPVLLSRELIEKLLRCSPEASESRLDRQLQRLPTGAVGRVAVDDVLILGNLNRPEDWFTFPDHERPADFRK